MNHASYFLILLSLFSDFFLCKLHFLNLQLKSDIWCNTLKQHPWVLLSPRIRSHKRTKNKAMVGFFRVLRMTYKRDSQTLSYLKRFSFLVLKFAAKEGKYLWFLMVFWNSASCSCKTSIFFFKLTLLIIGEQAKRDRPQCQWSKHWLY